MDTMVFKEHKGNSKTAIASFLAMLREDGVSQSTRHAYRSDLLMFEKDLLERNIDLMYARSADIQDIISRQLAAGIKPNTIVRYCVSLRRFYRHLSETGMIAADPMRAVSAPSSRRRTDLSVLTEIEVDALCNALVLSRPNEFRDRVIIELLYATGLQISKILALTVDRVDVVHKTIRMVTRIGRERIIPIPNFPCDYLLDYMQHAREDILLERATDYLFPTSRGTLMSRQAFWLAMKQYAKRAGITKSSSQRSLRRSFAVHSLRLGMRPSELQARFDHRDISTTHVYEKIAGQAQNRPLGSLLTTTMAARRESIGVRERRATSVVDLGGLKRFLPRSS